MNWFEKRRVLRLERKAQERYKEKHTKVPGHKNRGIAWGRILILIILAALAYYFREELIALIKGWF